MQIQDYLAKLSNDRQKQRENERILTESASVRH